ncbi:MAG: ABC transporter permease subunit [Oscillospiraceae bacterium]|nr:ABC transporter permease subunit [Oscillospiraceae bacterium]
MAVLLFWLTVWELLSLLVDRALLLPGPLAVAARLYALAKTAGFWETIALSLLRIAGAVAAGILLGTLLAVLAARSGLLRALLTPLLSVVKATPVASFIILTLLFLGRNLVPPFTAVLIVLPVVFGGVEAGISAVDPLLLELAAVYRLPAARRLRRIYVPAVLPQFLAAVRTSIGLAWKAGVAAEVLTVPLRSIGRSLYTAKLNLETTDLFAWTAVTILCSVLLEKLTMTAFGRLERRKGREKQDDDAL